MKITKSASCFGRFAKWTARATGQPVPSPCDSEAIQVKLDELLDLEELEEQDLERIRKSYEKLAQQARESLRQGGTDTDAPEVEDQ